MNISRRFLAILLSVLMVISYIPVFAYAAETNSIKNPVITGTFWGDWGEDNYTTWDCIWFGNYYQSNNQDKEPIKWRVLSVDGDDAFLLADLCLDSKPYHDAGGNITWENCSLRNWLNSDFINSAFSEDERTAIKKTKVINDASVYTNIDAGNDTLDQVYLLSYSEAVDTVYGFAGSDGEKESITRRAESTMYAKSQGGDQSVCYWFLRSPGYEQGYCTSITEVGWTINAPVETHWDYVRPCLHIDLSTSVWSYAGTVSSDGTVWENTTEPVGKGFKIPEDTNSFDNYYDDLYEGEWIAASSLTEKEKELYDIVYKNENRVAYYEPKDMYYVVTDKLRSKEPNGLSYSISEEKFDSHISGLSEEDKKTLIDHRDSLWNGSCHGIAVTMALSSQGIDLDENGITSTYNNADAPRYNRKLRDAINYHQILQYIDKGKDTCITYALFFPRRVDSVVITYDEFLQNLVSESIECEKQKKPFVFSYGYTHGEKDSGHSIIVYGVREAADRQYIIEMYDENNNAKVECSVNLDKGTIDFTDGNGNHIIGITGDVDNSNYNYLSYTGIEKLYGTVAKRTTRKDIDSRDHFRISAYKKCKITNDRGEDFCFDGNNYLGTMQIYDVGIIGEEEQSLILEVDPFDTLELKDFVDDFSFSGTIGNNYYTVNVDGADSVTISDGQVIIDGENYTFNCGIDAGIHNDHLYKISGKTSGQLTVSKNNGTIVADSDNPVEYAVVAACGNTSTEYTEASVVTEHIEIDIENGNDVLIEPIASGTSIEKCIVDLSSSVFTFDNREIEPTATVKYGVCYLEKEKDFTVSYINNVNPGTAQAIITGIGNYTGTISIPFTIEKDTPTPTPAPAVTPAPQAPAEIQDLPAVKMSKPAAAKKSVNVKWKKVTKKNLKKIQGIEIQVATDSGFTNIVKTATAGKKKTSKKIKGLTSKQTYYVRIRAYKDAADGKHVSVWKAKKVKIK